MHTSAGHVGKSWCHRTPCIHFEFDDARRCWPLHNLCNDASAFHGDTTFGRDAARLQQALAVEALPWLYLPQEKNLSQMNASASIMKR